MKPQISKQFKSRQPSSIRMAQIEYEKRRDGVKAIDLSVGNVSLPMHPAMKKAMFRLQFSKLSEGVVKYLPTIGMKNTQKTFLHLIQSSGFDADGLYCQVTDGASLAMELAILGTCESGRPLMLIEPTYANYRQLASRVGCPVISVTRELSSKGDFELPDLEKIEKLIVKHNPGALVVIPYDNPTGQLYTPEMMIELAKICVEYNMWFISDEAYRELYYEGDKVSLWGIDNRQIANIEGRRISIESSSKVFNACGLRIGGLVTDSVEFHRQAIAEYTANLSANTIGQIIFSSLLDETKEELDSWYSIQREYYRRIADEVYVGLKKIEPGIIISNPQSALYLVIDVRDLVDENFSADEFVIWAAREGVAKIGDQDLTLLLAPMSGFYSQENYKHARTQLRLAYVKGQEKMKLVPQIFIDLLNKYKNV